MRRRDGSHGSALACTGKVMLWGVAGVAVVLLAGSGCPRLDTPGPQAKLLKVNARQLTTTAVTADIKEPITTGTNLVWCATMPLAWNEMVALTGQKVDFLDDLPDPAALATLNEGAITKTVLDEPSDCATAGVVADGILDQITQTMQERFPEAEPNLPAAEVTKPEDFVAYAYLHKNLLFAKPFERLPEPLSFGGQDVLAFGISGQSRVDLDVLQQVSILDYENADDFVIELKTQSETDQVILAKVQPAATLEDTITAVLARMSGGQRETLREKDILKVPMFNFDITRSYDELAGRWFPAPALSTRFFGRPDVPYKIVSAIQAIRFELNEAGVRLESQTTIHGTMTSLPPQPISLVFDRPFLLMMKLTGAERPYFAMWIENAELLGRAE